MRQIAFIRQCTLDRLSKRHLLTVSHVEELTAHGSLLDADSALDDTHSLETVDGLSKSLEIE